MKHIKREYHGMVGTPVYIAWSCMKQRCANPNNAAYKNYGGRGITVCEEWRNSFMAYFNHVSKLENYGVEGYTLDRIDNDKGYYPGNVKYSTRSKQQSNKRIYGKSKHKGVNWHKATKKWQSYIKINGNQIYLGLFTHELEAHQAVQKALKELTEKEAAIKKEELLYSPL